MDGPRLLVDQRADHVGGRRARRGAAAIAPAIPQLSALTDTVPIAAAAALIGGAALVGRRLLNSGVELHLPAPPLLARWLPHVGAGTPFAIGIAVLAVAVSGRWAQRLPWRPLLVTGYLTSVAWTTSLALVDGWQRGWVQRLTDRGEYLHDLPRIGNIGAFLRGFTSHILDFQPGSWTTHVSSHPPAATLVFLLADRIGLGGGAWAGALVVAVGATTAVAVPVTLRALGAPRAARAVLPFVVFFPGAVWIGVSADGLFTGVAAAAVAVIAVGVTGRRRLSPPLALAGGLLLGLTFYLSYGLALMITLVAATLLCSARLIGLRGRFATRCLLVLLGVAAVVVLFSAAGFSWLRGVDLVHTRYYQGIASVRPYHYFVWANLAALALSAGPVAAAGITRAIVGILRFPRCGWFPLTGQVTAADGQGAETPGSRADGAGAARQSGAAQLAEAVVPAALAVAALIAVVAADLTGLSKAETERIWLPFGIWLMTGLALLPRRAARWALAGQVLTALLINHLLLTHW